MGANLFNMKKVKVLIACEESQAVCIEFRKLGIEAYSCDILPCSGGRPEWHILMDVTQLINGHYAFMTMDRKIHFVEGEWDAIIAFPPCTDLAVSGAAWFSKKRENGEQLKSIKFFKKFLDCDCQHVAIENPVGIIGGKYIRRWFPDYAHLPKPTQIIEPYYFGDHANKKTCLWLKGLPELKHDPSEHVSGSTYFEAPSGRKYPDWCQKTGGGCGVVRSKTFPGIAKNIASQWGEFLLSRKTL